MLVQVLLERGEGGGSIVSEDGRHCFVFYIYICKQSVSLSPKMINVEGVEKMARGGGFENVFCNGVLIVRHSIIL